MIEYQALIAKGRFIWRKPKLKDITGLIENEEGRLIAWHYLGTQLRITAKFNDAQGLSEFVKNLYDKRYSIQEQKSAERRVA